MSTEPLISEQDRLVGVFKNAGNMLTQEEIHAFFKSVKTISSVALCAYAKSSFTVARYILLNKTLRKKLNSTACAEICESFPDSLWIAAYTRKDIGHPINFFLNGTTNARARENLFDLINMQPQYMGRLDENNIQAMFSLIKNEEEFVKLFRYLLSSPHTINGLMKILSNEEADNAKYYIYTQKVLLKIEGRYHFLSAHPDIASILYASYPEYFAQSFPEAISKDVWETQLKPILQKGHQWIQADHLIALDERMIHRKEWRKYLVGKNKPIARLKTWALNTIKDKSADHKRLVSFLERSSDVRGWMALGKEPHLMARWIESANHEADVCRLISMDDYLWKNYKASRSSSFEGEQLYLRMRRRFDDNVKFKFYRKDAGVLMDHINSKDFDQETAFVIAEKYFEKIRPVRGWFESEEKFYARVEHLKNKSFYFRAKLENISLDTTSLQSLDPVFLLDALANTPPLLEKFILSPDVTGDELIGLWKSGRSEIVEQLKLILLKRADIFIKMLNAPSNDGSMLVDNTFNAKIAEILSDQTIAVKLTKSARKLLLHTKNKAIKGAYKQARDQFFPKQLVKRKSPDQKQKAISKKRTLDARYHVSPAAGRKPLPPRVIQQNSKPCNADDFLSPIPIAPSTSFFSFQPPAAIPAPVFSTPTPPRRFPIKAPTPLPRDHVGWDTVVIRKAPTPLPRDHEGYQADATEGEASQPNDNDAVVVMPPPPPSSSHLQVTKALAQPQMNEKVSEVKIEGIADELVNSILTNINNTLYRTAVIKNLNQMVHKNTDQETFQACLTKINKFLKQSFQGSFDEQLRKACNIDTKLAKVEKAGTDAAAALLRSGMIDRRKKLFGNDKENQSTNTTPIAGWTP